MRLLFLVSRDGTSPRAAGGDVQGSLYARYLAEAGHQVTYLTSSSPGSPDREERDGVMMRRLGKPELLWWRMYHYYRWWGGQFDVVYEEAFGGAKVPFCAPLYVKQPMLTAWYQINQPIFVEQMGRATGSVLGWLERWVARVHRRATILTPSEVRRGDLIDYGFSPEQVFAVPPVAIEEESLDPPDTADRPPTIVWLGKLRRYKSVHHAVQAMPAVIKRCPDAKLVIAGRRDDEGYRQDLLSQIERLGLNGAVDFAFDLSEDEKRELLGRARVMGLPSPIEGFGIVLLEAAAQGTPAVVSEGIPREVIEDGYNGLRVPFGDRERLADAITSVLQSADLHKTLATNAIEHARGFSKHGLQTKLEQVLQRAASPPVQAKVPA